ncbi:DUF2860 family protein [Vibrio ostreicida]|uniref:DUF2860 family protein n=1 Tax=Vibrio ostreicida TaxID=526588 RepID=A0ABT8C078_9VIBR|nr:DUF2860 family protein [Vibrio ostreicida]MDN3612059.1 DUF2860 family protein [Vibrio ostreicida]NPD08769.1 DUF2860 family protein [Vibrio ostreicida]
MTHSNLLLCPMLSRPSLSSLNGTKGTVSLSMKRCSQWLTVGCLLATPLAYAEQQNTTGFHGSVSLFTGVDGTNSVMDTESQANITDYSASQDRQSEAVVIPFWDLNYRFDGSSEVYFKTDIVGMASDFYAQAGYRHYWSDGSNLAIGVVPGFLEKEVWKNPYQLYSDRETTNAAVQGLVLSYDRVLGSDWSIELARGKYEVDQEESLAQLDRNSNLSYAELNYRANLNASWGVEWLISYLDVDASGSALKSQRVSTEAELQLRSGRHIALLAGSAGLQKFDDTHPIWERTREDTTFGVSATYLYAAPFDWQNTLFIARGGWDITDANIDFYDHDEYLVTLGIQYRF